MTGGTNEHLLSTYVGTRYNVDQHGLRKTQAINMARITERHTMAPHGKQKGDYMMDGVASLWNLRFGFGIYGLEMVHFCFLLC